MSSQSDTDAATLDRTVRSRVIDLEGYRRGGRDAAAPVVDNIGRACNRDLREFRLSLDVAAGAGNGPSIDPSTRCRSDGDVAVLLDRFAPGEYEARHQIEPCAFDPLAGDHVLEGGRREGGQDRYDSDRNQQLGERETRGATVKLRVHHDRLVRLPEACRRFRAKIVERHGAVTCLYRPGLRGSLNDEGSAIDGHCYVVVLPDIRRNSQFQEVVEVGRGGECNVAARVEQILLLAVGDVEHEALCGSSV